MINRNSPALHDKHLIRVTDLETRQPLEFEVVSSGGDRLRSISLAFPQLQSPRKAAININGLFVEDLFGRRIATGGSASASSSSSMPTLRPLVREGFGLPPAIPPSGNVKPFETRVDPVGGGAPPPQESPPPPPPVARGQGAPPPQHAIPPQGIAPPPPPKPPSGRDGGPSAVDRGTRPPSIPEFPFPPPMYSSREVVQRTLLVGDKDNPSLDDVADVLDNAFEECGYGKRSYYSVPHGFAMASSLEQIEDDGTPKKTHRWSLQVEPMARFSLQSYMSALFRARPGHYRVIVFMITDLSFGQSARPNSEDARHWVDTGGDSLPEEIGARAFTTEHKCTALIYEFRRVADAPPEFVDPSEITAGTHLKNTGFLAALEAKH
ncbi:MAG: hypothetical protein M3Z22_04195 [Verrucomicrobiota bacterium]|nr:hypothetical protein [Verrucomicrobiota bacterium]